MKSYLLFSPNYPSPLAPHPFPFRWAAIRWLNVHRSFEENKKLVAGSSLVRFFPIEWLLQYSYRGGNLTQRHTSCLWSVSFHAIAVLPRRRRLLHWSKNVLYVSFHTTPPEGPLVHDVLTLFNHMRQNKKEKNIRKNIKSKYEHTCIPIQYRYQKRQHQQCW